MANLQKFGAAATAALMLSACATTQDGQQTQAEGTALGAIIGGIAGAAIGNDAGSALAGAAIGGLGGYVVGTAVAERKQQYANLEDYYDGQISLLDQVNTQIIERNRQAQLDLKRLKKELRNQATRAQAVAEMQSAQQKNRELLSLSADEIKAQRDGVEQERTGSKLPPSKVKAWSAKCDEAQKNMDELTKLNDQFDSAKYL